MNELPQQTPPDDREPQCSVDQTQLQQLARDFTTRLDQLLKDAHFLHPVEFAARVENYQKFGQVFFQAYWMLIRAEHMDAQAFAFWDSLHHPGFDGDKEPQM